MLHKKMLPVAVATALVAGLGATQAQAIEVSGNVALTSDYRFRGISQTDEDIAVQGGFDVGFEPGFYVGIWGSSVDFGDGDETGDYGTLELDYYAGWAGSIGDTDFTIDVGYLYYDYPADTVDPEGDYQEFMVGAGWRDLSLTLYYSDDFYAETDEAWYLSADYSFSILEDLSIGLHAGYSSFDDDDGPFAEGDGLDGTDEYIDYSVSVTYSWSGVDFSLAYVGTDLDEDDVGEGIEELADDTAVFTISKSL